MTTKRVKRGLMSCPQIQLSPGGKSYSFDHLRAIIEKLDELRNVHFGGRGYAIEKVLRIVQELLEVYEDED